MRQAPASRKLKLFGCISLCTRLSPFAGLLPHFCKPSAPSGAVKWWDGLASNQNRRGYGPGLYPLELPPHRIFPAAPGSHPATTFEFRSFPPRIVLGLMGSSNLETNRASLDPSRTLTRPRQETKRPGHSDQSISLPRGVGPRRAGIPRGVPGQPEGHPGSCRAKNLPSRAAPREPTAPLGFVPRAAASYIGLIGRRPQDLSPFLGFLWDLPRRSSLSVSLQSHNTFRPRRCR